MANTYGRFSAPPEILSTAYEDIQERVRRRAYELYEQGGRENRHDLEDWLRAESELLPRRFAIELVTDGVKLVAA